MWRTLRKLAATVSRGAIDLLAPPFCLHCNVPLFDSDDTSFCSECAAAVFGDPHETCPRCAATIGPYSSTDDGCPVCRAETFAFESVQRLGRYEGALRDVILRLKKPGTEGLAEVMGERWADSARERLSSLKADCLVPVPLHWMRRFSRGHNQSLALSLGLSRRLGLPVLTRTMTRSRRTPAQSSIPHTHRKDNVRDAFVADRKSIPVGKTLLLIDDVLTTGATLHEAARALRRAGAARVVAAVLARAGRD